MDTRIENQRIEDLMAEIRELAPHKQHNLGRDMTGSKTLTPQAALMVLQHLRSRPDVEGYAPAPAADVSRETATPASISRGTGPVASKKTPPPMSAFNSLPAGYYATPSLTGNNDYDFWLVERGKGKWAGSTFVRRVLGGPGEGERKPRTVKLENMLQRLAAQAIVKYGPEDAANLFGDELRCCIDCGSPLTDEVSRAERRGPTCRGKSR